MRIIKRVISMSNVENDTLELAEKYDTVSDSQFENGLVLIEKLGINEGSSILDVGCGTGRLALYTARKIGAVKAVGIDPSPLRIEVANRKIRDGSPVTFRVGHAENLGDFKDNSFDAAYLCAVFHWITDKKTALKEIHRVLKPGGKVGLTTGDKRMPFTLRKIIDDVLVRNPYAGQVDINNDSSKPVTRHELIDLFESTGYQDINISNKIIRLYFQTPQQVFEFMEASSFGTFLMHVPEHLRPHARKDIENDLEKKRTPKGIELVSNTLFAIANKNN